MKFTIKAVTLMLALMASINGMAQEVTQQQKDGSATRVSSCVIQKAPSGWDSVLTMLDRTDSAKPMVLYNIAHFSDPNRVSVHIDVSGCDSKQQVEDLLMFRAIIPANQTNWKILYLGVNKQNQYNVFTDIAIAAQQTALKK